MSDSLPVPFLTKNGDILEIDTLNHLEIDN